MIVYDSINPHVFEKETDEFIEITLNKSGVNLYDWKLKIGMTLYELFELLGKDYTNNENSLIYSKHDKIAFFKIDNDLVSKIKIGIYKKGTDPKKVLENSNW